MGSRSFRCSSTGAGGFEDGTGGGFEGATGRTGGGAGGWFGRSTAGGRGGGTRICCVARCVGSCWLGCGARGGGGRGGCGGGGSGGGRNGRGRAGGAAGVERGRGVVRAGRLGGLQG